MAKAKRDKAPKDTRKPKNSNDANRANKQSKNGMRDASTVGAATRPSMVVQLVQRLTVAAGGGRRLSHRCAAAPALACLRGAAAAAVQCASPRPCLPPCACLQVRRLAMYNSKAKRDKRGKIISQARTRGGGCGSRGRVLGPLHGRGGLCGVAAHVQKKCGMPAGRGWHACCGALTAPLLAMSHAASPAAPPAMARLTASPAAPPASPRPASLPCVQDFQSKELPSTRIQPDRRWFGNTRVIGQKQLEAFREEMGAKVRLRPGAAAWFAACCGCLAGWRARGVGLAVSRGRLCTGRRGDEKQMGSQGAPPASVATSGSGSGSGKQTSGGSGLCSLSARTS